MIGAELPQFRILHRAGRFGEDAARVKAAARRQIERRGNGAFYRQQAITVFLDLWNAAE